MRHIRKQPQGVASLHDEHQNPPTTAREARRRWRAFKRNVGRKTELRNALNNEQYGLCAYTELRPDIAGLGVHFEHIKPRSKFPELTFSHENLVLCALGGDDLSNANLGGNDPSGNDLGGDGIADDGIDDNDAGDSESTNNAFGGHAKGDEFDDELFLSPLQSRPMEHGLLYLSDGNVTPFPSTSEHQRRKVEYTIGLLNLNAAYLVNQRKRWIGKLNQRIKTHADNAAALYKLAADSLVPVDNKLSPFFTATRQRLSRTAEQVLEEHAPELT